MSSLRRIWLLVAVLALASPVQADVQLLDWADLRGWESDDHAVALDVFRETCRDLKEGDWPTVCALSDGVTKRPWPMIRLRSPSPSEAAPRSGPPGAMTAS